MDELHQSLQAMGVAQHLCAVAFLILYALALGGFLGSASRLKVIASAALAATAFVAMSDVWVHGVLMIAFAILSAAAYLAVAWMLKVFCEALLRRTSHLDHMPSPVPAPRPLAQVGERSTAISEPVLVSGLGATDCP